MTVYKNDDVLYSTIEYRRQKVPVGNFFLKNIVNVVADDEIKIIGNYTTQSTTRTVLSASDGVSGNGTAVFTSATGGFAGEVVAGDMLIIKSAGADIGSYIVLSQDDDNTLTLDDHAGDPAVFNDLSGLEYEVGLIIFSGLIEGTDFGPSQEIEVTSRGEEILQERPAGDYSGYSEVIWGEMLKDASLSDVTINFTDDTLTKRPSSDVSEDGDWDDPHGNNNPPLFDDIQEAIPDDSYIESSVGGSEFIVNIAAHGLSADYNYLVTDVKLRIYARRDEGFDIGVLGYLYFSGGYEFLISEVVTEDWVWYEGDISGLYSQDDLADMKVKVVTDGSANTLKIDTIEVIITYRYYNDFDDPGSNVVSLTAVGEKSLEDYGNLFALLEQQAWYLDAGLNIFFNNGDKDSGESFAKTD